MPKKDDNSKFNFETEKRTLLKAIEDVEKDAFKKLQEHTEKYSADLKRNINKSIIDQQEAIVNLRLEADEKAGPAELEHAKELATEISVFKQKEQKKLAAQELKDLKNKLTYEKAKNGDKNAKKELNRDDRKKLGKELHEEKSQALRDSGHAGKAEWNDAWYNMFQEFNESLTQTVGEQSRDSAIKALTNTVKAIGKGITDGLNAINQSISKYASYQTQINSRTQGLFGEALGFSKLTETLNSVAYSPLIKTEELYANLNSLVNEGIGTNVAQRAFFQTIKDGIASTFDVNESYLKRIIRIQQKDSTAARLGMEGYLTRFLNTFVESTEYLTSTFDTVADNLLEATSLMSVKDSTELEFVVQKWLGTLTGVGVSESTASSISQALGYLGSGNIDSLMSSDVNNLLIMAASKMNLSYAELLTKGLDSTNTENLMKGITLYLQELAQNSSNIVKSQLSSIFGVTISDLKAVQNLSQADINSLRTTKLSYSDMYSELSYQFNQLSSRQGISNILENLFSNYTFQTGMNIASNPATYALWKITDLIQSTTNGISIPYVTAFGNGIDLEATVENLMKTALVGVSTLGSIGGIIDGLASVGNGSVLLKALQISSGTDSTSRGRSISKRQSGSSVSQSTYIGNTDSGTYYSSTLASATDEANKSLDAQIEEQAETDPVYQFLTENRFDIVAGRLDNIYDVNKEILSTNILALGKKGIDIISNVSSSERSTAFTNYVDDLANPSWFSGWSLFGGSKSVSSVTNETSVTDYLIDMKLKETLSNIDKNISTLVNDGINVKNMGGSSFFGNIIQDLTGLN